MGTDAGVVKLVVHAGLKILCESVRVRLPPPVLFYLIVMIFIYLSGGIRTKESVL